MSGFADLRTDEEIARYKRDLDELAKAASRTKAFPLPLWPWEEPPARPRRPKKLAAEWSQALRRP